MFLPKILEIQN